MSMELCSEGRGEAGRQSDKVAAWVLPDWCINLRILLPLTM